MIGCAETGAESQHHVNSGMHDVYFWKSVSVLILIISSLFKILSRRLLISNLIKGLFIFPRVSQRMPGFEDAAADADAVAAATRVHNSTG